jgi:hypothetical protein
MVVSIQIITTIFCFKIIPVYYNIENTLRRMSMSTVEELQKERMEIRSDLLAGKKPKRVLVAPAFSWEFACQLAGVDMKQAHFNFLELTEKAIEKVCQTFQVDVSPTRSLRFANVYYHLGAKNWVIGSNGVIQHPEIATMELEEYDEFINAPYKTIIEKFLPRACSKLAMDPYNNALNLATAYGAFKNISGAQAGLIGKFAAKYGYAPGFVNHQLLSAPFDFVADQLRGFTRINMDTRRIPDKVKAAVDAVTPIMIKMATPIVKRPGLCAFIPLHLGPFLNQKIFEELYWPSLEKMVVELDKVGVACALFVEQDWTRFAPFLERLPKSSIMYMEAGDPKVFAETVGKDHVIGGFYDPTISLARSKEECIDEMKRLLDIVMKTGKYYLTFDRSVMDVKSIDVSKIQAVLEYVTLHAEY